MRTKILGFRIFEHPEPWPGLGNKPDEVLAFHIEIDVAAFHDDGTFLGIRRVEIDHTLANFPANLEAPLIQLLAYLEDIASKKLQADIEQERNVLPARYKGLEYKLAKAQETKVKKASPGSQSPNVPT
ncbi:MAG: hypothetical protein QXJ64_08845 [Thermosphaera sp.]